MECPVCYSNKANCKLVCGHSLCRACIKEWYYKSDGGECTCPMCRQRLYFKGMYKVADTWDQERFEQKNQEAFAEAFENIIEEFENFYEDSESDTDSEIDEDDESDSDSDFWYPEGFSEYRSINTLDDMMFIQERFGLLQRAGYQIETELLENSYYDIARCYAYNWYEDFSVAEKFVSKHKGAQQGRKRVGARRLEKVSQPEENIEFSIIVCVN